MLVDDVLITQIHVFSVCFLQIKKWRHVVCFNISPLLSVNLETVFSPFLHRGCASRKIGIPEELRHSQKNQLQDGNHNSIEHNQHSTGPAHAQCPAQNMKINKSRRHQFVSETPSLSPTTNLQFQCWQPWAVLNTVIVGLLEPVRSSNSTKPLIVSVQAT